MSASAKTPNARRASRRNGFDMKFATGWALHDAKARFSEVVRQAREKGPQRITSRGRDAVVVVKAEEFDRLSALDRPQPDLHTFLSGSPLKDIEFEFESVRSPVREVEL